MRRLAFVCTALGLWACSPAPTPSTSASASQVEAATCAEPCPSASSTSGPFKLELVLPRVDWKSDEPVTGAVTLSYGGPQPATIWGSSDFLNFGYAEVGGPHHVEPAGRADCRRRTIDTATPISEPLSKSGGFSEDDPDVAWLRSFLTAPDVRLVAGMWDVTAFAEFNEGDQCAAGGRSMKATVRVTVTD